MTATILLTSSGTSTRTSVKILAVFFKPGKWLTQDGMLGLSHGWHDKYSEPCTRLLGMDACSITLKNFGIGSDERNR